MAKKFDRFGWARDMGSAAQDRLIKDWIDALVDFPLAEIQAACREAVLDNPNKMPNEGHIRAQIMKARSKIVAAMPRQTEDEQERRHEGAPASHEGCEACHE